MMRKSFLYAAAVLAGVLMAPSAQAQITISSYDWNPNVIKADEVWYNGSLVLDNVGAGRFELLGTENGNPVDFFTYCADLFQPIHPGVFTREPVSLVLPNAVKQAQLLTLLQHSETEIAAAPTVLQQRIVAAATQLAVWEIIYEAGTGAGAYDANAGTVYTVNPNSAPTSARALANTYLNNITSLAWIATAAKSLVLLYAPKNQSQLMLATSAVPEPSTWATMIVGAGMIGGVMRRKRRAEAKAAA